MTTTTSAPTPITGTAASTSSSSSTTRVQIFTPGDHVPADVSLPHDAVALDTATGLRRVTRICTVVMDGRRERDESTSTEIKNWHQSSILETRRDPTAIDVGDCVYGRVHQLQNDRIMIHVLAKENNTTSRAHEDKVKCAESERTADQVQVLVNHDADEAAETANLPEVTLLGSTTSTRLATLRKTDMRAFKVDELEISSYFRVGDIIRAHVIGKSADMTLLSTMHSDDGVLAARSSSCAGREREVLAPGEDATLSGRGSGAGLFSAASTSVSALKPLSHEFMLDAASGVKERRKVACGRRKSANKILQKYSLTEVIKS
ncbi:unnamed protein product [Amoebophrya sp. A120]|nr:unnamed protein product [Amoebophrya sp. A120]|eukprot:GSA120T00017595001.1